MTNRACAISGGVPAAVGGDPMGMHTRFRIAVGAAAALLAAAWAPASASARVNSFDGSCSLKGTASFSPPATNSQQSLTVSYDGPGTCSGTLNGRPVSDMPVRARNFVRNVDGSCLRADTTEPGRASLAFADGTVIRFSSEFHFVGTHGTFTLRGERAGSATGIGSFVTDRTPPDLALQCAGAGVASAPLDISLATDGPVTSGRANRKASTFSGECELSGRVVFRPRLTNTPQPVSQRVRAPGTCSGTFVDRRGRTHQLADAPAVFTESSRGESASCAAGTAEGHGALRFRRLGRIRFAFSETRAGGSVVASAQGRRAGSAHGTGGVSRSEDPAVIARKCAGRGLKRVRIDVQLATTPSISG